MCLHDSIYLHVLSRHTPKLILRIWNTSACTYVSCFVVASLCQWTILYFVWFFLNSPRSWYRHVLIPPRTINQFYFSLSIFMLSYNYLLTGAFFFHHPVIYVNHIEGVISALERSSHSTAALVSICHVYFARLLYTTTFPVNPT